MSNIVLNMFFLSVLAYFISCEDTKKNGQIEYPKEPVDVLTAATPNGGKLLAAEEGPVRSALGTPEIDKKI